ncbi:MAG TPA: DUF3131 domain-containing protein [Gemmatimonadaceae bacterium]|nr:DUF3131 domain-containing protein [Gemmatimonadaceae bacterium]
MKARQIIFASLTLSAAVVANSTCSKAQQPPPSATTGAVPAAAQTAIATPEERDVYTEAARNSWNFVNSITEPTTGLARAHARYSYVTLWDVAGSIAANYVAHELAFINDETYDAHISKILSTLSTVDLFDKGALNRTYDAKTGRMVDNASHLSSVGAGFSSVDIGRLLIWLRILSTKQPKYAPLAAQIVRRLDMSKLLDDGFLRGIDVDPRGRSRSDFQETEIGYQQYSLSGFAMWGARVDRSGLDVKQNVRVVNIMGTRLLTDDRGNDRVMSEPYIMLGIELGYRSPELRYQASQVLAAQNARYQRTRLVTAVTEDALPDPPYYFYYYSLWHNGRPFMVEGKGQNQVVERPRWVSSKAAFGWNAVFPNPYTALLLQTVQPARTANGWGAGVYEGTLKPTGIPSLNTAAMIMEAALYKIRGRPIYSN